MPKFFIPAATDKEQEQSLYSGIKQFLEKELGAKFSDLKVCMLEYTHDGNHYHAEVGKTHTLNGEPVIAILHDSLRDLYCVCTPNRGVLRGMPILVGAHSVRQSIIFDE